MHDEDDPRRPAEGVVLGCCLGLAIWAFILCGIILAYS
jgi:hypothetical protein